MTERSELGSPDADVLKHDCRKERARVVGKESDLESGRPRERVAAATLAESETR